MIVSACKMFCLENTSEFDILIGVYLKCNGWYEVIIINYNQK